MKRSLLALFAALTFVLAGCSSTESEDATKIRFALDWTPNTNHTGLYVALHEGYFEDAGLDVEVLPYNDTNPDVLVDAGKAEFGVGFQESTMKSMAQGADVKSVLAVMQRWASEIAVLASRDDIQSPKDLDGKTYGGFGEEDSALVSGVIQAAGGKGDFETVTLGTTAYEALYSGDVDFTIPFVAWEGIEAEERGVDLKTFAYGDYGFPESYQLIILGNGTWLEKHPDEAKKFVQALQKGYQYSIDNPDEAAQILQDENKDLLTDVDMLKKSQRMLAETFMLDDNGKFGRQEEAQWAALAKFFEDKGLLDHVDDWSQHFTNAYLLD